ncbi:glyoxalase/Bleomycin resistance /Dioxygenase superfamily protein [Paraburkholderia xenovorans LB400]|uniref:Ring-cleavage dioxygenase n=1 Tax=Paraburkholderia xenovorans (strain LB400) TaxID=266265 RepID=Q13GB5_PARXL|nr:VOC family protein [Paraburkholderia xenovorans]ABE36874.1 Putative ring-cleavage dioxygenase [Paraburkholderia xenovorans LB400]AIP34516.1 glyoxalase/Bleomycin resistance /Dioxygenase superfamily protein [Paraburkholderia xenovorans LB400]
MSLLRPQLNHLGLYTARMEAMERFYVDVMGLIVTDRGSVPRLGNAEIVFMSASSDAHHQVALVARPDQSAPSCINQIAFRVDSLGALRTMYEAMKTAAVAPIQPIDHGNAWSIYSADPDGNGIEVYLDSPWQVAQPHSRPLDLSQDDKAIIANTETAIRSDPTLQTRQAWSRDMLARLER